MHDDARHSQAWRLDGDQSDDGHVPRGRPYSDGIPAVRGYSRRPRGQLAPGRGARRLKSAGTTKASGLTGAVVADMSCEERVTSTTVPALTGVPMGIAVGCAGV